MMTEAANDNTPAEIDQIDEVLCEDNKTVMFYGHTPNEALVYTSSFELPKPIDRATFSRCEWLDRRNIRWTRHEGVQSC